jgi:hypothetical protein
MWKNLVGNNVPSEMKMSEKTKKSLKRFHDKQGREQENSILISDKETCHQIAASLR